MKTWQRYKFGKFCNVNFGSTGAEERQVEESALLSSIDNADPKETLISVELGAGWGQNSLFVAGYCATLKRKCRCFAVEADPIHYGWMVQTFTYNRIHSTPIFGAISDQLGYASFNNVGKKTPDKWWGQHLTRPNEKGSLQVPTFTLAWLFETFKLPRIHILHIDVQGAETLAIQGGLDYLHRIDNVIIGIHVGNHLTDIPKLFAKHSPDHNVLLALPKKAGKHLIKGFNKPININSDGILILRKEN